MSLLGVVEKLDTQIEKNHEWYESSTEAIKFQANSKFPADLTKLFQKILDFANDHDREFGEVTNTDQAIVKHVKLKKFMEHDINLEIIETIEKYTKFKVSDITSALPNTVNNMFSVWVRLNDYQPLFNDIITVVTATTGRGEEVKQGKSLRALLDISKSLDKDKGQILRGANLSITIGLPVGIFVIKDFITDNVDKCQMTATEIASVILHEIGHIFSWVECMVDLCYTGYYGNNILRDAASQFEKNPKKTIKEAIEIAEEHPEEVESALHRTILKSTTVLLSRIEKRIENILVTDTVDPSNKDKNQYAQSHYLFQIAIILLKLIIAIKCGWKEIIIKAGSTAIPIYRLISVLIPEQKNVKEMNTAKTVSMYERLADEFVSRYGMSKYLNSALMKLQVITDEFKKIGWNDLMYEKSIRDSAILRLVVKAACLPDRIINYLGSLVETGFHSPYELDYDRLRRNINNLHDVIKDLHIDPKVRSIIVKDIEEMEKDLAAAKPGLEDSLIKKILKFLMNIPGDVLVGAPQYIFGSAGADKEYYELFEHLDTMLSNKGFYYSAKIDEMVKKGKH